MITPEKFWNKMAVRYSKQPIKNVDAYEQTLDRTRAYLSADAEVLEVGCGTGSTALILAENVGHITGSDLSTKMIEIATEKAEKQGVENVRFLASDVRNRGLNNGAFDVVLGFNLLHLLNDRPTALSKVHQLLKPGGVFISKTACLKERTSLWRILIFFMQLFGIAPYVSYLSAKDLEAEILAAGFEIIEACSFTGSRGSWFVAARNK